MPEAISIFDGPDCSAGELRCGPDDDTWGEAALVTRPIVAVPFTPTWVVRRGGDRQVVNPNHVVVHQAGDEYRRERFEGNGYRCLFAYPSPALIREIAAEFDPAAEADPDYRIPTALASLDPAGFSLGRGLARARADQRDPVGVSEALYRLLRAIVSSAYRGRAAPAREGRASTRRAHQSVVEEAKAAMTSRFAERLTVEELATSIHVSPYHLTRVFRRRTGFGLHEYLDQLRLRAALERILDGNRDLAGLAADLGFSSHSHLSANFRRAFGVPPSRARSAGRGGTWPASSGRAGI